MAKMSVSSNMIFSLFLWTQLAVLTGALPNEPYLLYSNRTNIGSIDLNNLAKRDVTSGLHSVLALDVDRVEQKIYYGEYSLGEIYRMNMDGTNKELLFRNMGEIEGIAVDWIARLVYWTSDSKDVIQVASLDGKHRKILLNTGFQHPRGIALDPKEGYLFWSDWGIAAIERSTLAGGDRKVLVNSNLVWPNGITIDYANKRLYWIDAHYDTITSIDYDGGQRTKTFEDTSLYVSQYHGFDLEIISDILYWTDWNQNSIYGLKQTSGTIIKTIPIQTSRTSQGVTGVVAVHSSRQPTMINRCGSNNGGCQQLCLLEPNGFKCACAIGFQLAADGKLCDDSFKDEFIMFADGGAGEIYQLQIDSDNVEPVPIKFTADANISRPVALEFDPVEDRVYWTDVTLKIISRAFRNGTEYQTLFADKVGTADGLTVDLAGRNLYWTSTTFDTIEVSKLDGSFRRVLIDSNLNEPRDIIVDPVAGYMYWTDWGIPKIERAYMDGSSRSELVNQTIGWPNGLTIDHVYNRLYWADASEDSIEFYDLETGQRDVLINEKFVFWGILLKSTNEINQPFGLTLLHKHLYWTDWRTDSVYRAEINSGANITRLATGLNRPMDIHAYSVKPKQEYRKTFTFAFPSSFGSTFACINSVFCPVIPEPPQCPNGFSSSREEAACGVSCREIVGYRYRCQCRNWKECAAKQSYAKGCISGYHASYRVRECIQAVKPGRCPYKVTEGSRRACTNDQGCPGEEKCCNGVCAKSASIATHPCQINNGGCDQLCLAIPGGRRCKCENNVVYDEVQKRCAHSVTTPTVPTTISTPGVSCTRPTPPGNGSISNCSRSSCSFECNEGFQLKGNKVLYCSGSLWNAEVPTCKKINAPTFSNCPSDISVPTDPGVATKTVSWIPPTATDFEGTKATVTVRPAGLLPPVLLKIGKTMIEYTATDYDYRKAYCQFSVEVKDEEPPSYGNTCPQDITNKTYTNDDVYVTWVPPQFMDNSDEQTRITTTGRTGSSKYPVGTTTITYFATDAAGLTTNCSFDIHIIKISGPSFLDCSNNITVATDPGVDTKTVTWTVPTATDYEGNTVTIAVKPAGYVPPVKFNIGETIIEYRTTDTNAPTAYCRFSVEVKDEEPPSYGNTCPQDIKKYTHNNDDVHVTWITPTITDNSKEPITIKITGNTPSSKYPVGTRTITYSATDTAGLATTCSFHITVIKTSKPVFSNCPNNVSVPTDPGAATKTVTWTVPTATDFEGNPATVTVKPVGSVPPFNFNIGKRMIEYKATDGHSRTAYCRFSIEIKDEEPPSYGNTCPQDITMYTPNEDVYVTWTAPKFTDNSGKSIPSDPSRSSTYPVGTTTISYSATDDAGLTTTCSFNITVIKTSKPVFFNCPNNVSVQTDPSVANKTVTWTVPTATDYEGKPATVTVRPTGSVPPVTFSIGIRTIEYKATEIHSPTAYCRFSVEVKDKEPPRYGNTCPQDIKKYTHNNDDVSVTWVPPKFTDNSGERITVTTTGLTGTSKYPVGVRTITYSAADTAGLTTTCSFNITVTKTSKPVFSSCPNDISVPTDPGVANKTVTWTVPTATDYQGKPAAVRHTGYVPPVNFKIGRRTIEYEATEIHSPPAYCRFSVEVKDTEPPSYGNTCPQDIKKYTHNNDGAYVEWVTPKFTDNSGEPTTIKTTGQSGSSKYPVGTTTITYSATDTAGLTTKCSFSIKIIKTSEPVFSNCPNNISVPTDPGVPTKTVTWTVPTATDFEGKKATVSVRPAGSLPPVLLNIGKRTIEYTATDVHSRTANCRFSIEVKDKEPPSYGNTCPQDIKKYTHNNDDVYVTWVTPKFSDNSGERVTVTTTGLTGTSKYPVGRRTITYLGTDAAGLTANCSFDIDIVRASKPVFSNCPNNVSVATDPGVATKTVNWTVPTATDYEGKPATVTVRPTGSVPPVTFSIGIRTIEYKATEIHSPTAYCRFSVEVKDNEPPSYGDTCPQDIKKYTHNNDDVHMTWLTPTFTDNSGKPITVTTTGQSETSTYPVGTTTITYSATDTAGLITKCSFSITVIRTRKPVFSHCLNNISKPTDPGEATATVNWPVPTARDYEGKPAIVSVNPDFYPPVKLRIGVRKVEYTATGGRSQTAFCRFFVEVKDEEPPSHGNTCPQDIKKYTENNDDVYVTWEAPKFTDNSGESITVKITGQSGSSKYSVGTTLITYSATDTAGLTTKCSFSIKIIKTSPPAFFNCPSDISVPTDPGVATKTVIWTVPTATDFEGKPVTVTVKPARYVPPIKLGISKQMIAYTARDDEAGRTAYCRFFIEVKDEEPPSYGNSCPQDIKKYTDKNDDVYVTWAPPRSTDNSGEPTTVRKTGLTGSSKYPVGTTTITYSATDTAGLTTTCSFTIRVINVCSKSQCNRWQTCQLKNNEITCVCNAVCQSENKPVCGSDGKTYANECKLKEAQCIENKHINVVNEGECHNCKFDCTTESKQLCGSDGKTYLNRCELDAAQCNEKKPINVIKTGPCGCGNLEINEQFKNSSSLTCKADGNSVECEVTCQHNYNAVFPDFLKLRCEENKWIRGNNAGKYVPIKNPKDPPKCYRTSTDSTCPKGQLKDTVCVPCPPGSFHDQKNSKCKECDVSQYQDTAEETSCKLCPSTKTSTTTGAESCFFTPDGSSVEISFISESDVNLRKAVSEGLTKYCSDQECTFSNEKTRRKKRASGKITFEEEDVLILSKKPGNKLNEYIAELFILDPESTSLVPDKTFSTKVSESLLKIISDNKYLPFHLKIIHNDVSDTESQTGTGTKPVPIIAGAVGGFVVIIVLVISIYTHKRRQKRRRGHENTPTDQSSQQGSQGGCRLYTQAAVVNQAYQAPNDFPPPYDAPSFSPPFNTPGGSHVYEVVDDINDFPLYAKQPIFGRGGGFVGLIPPKQVELPYEKSTQHDFPLRVVSNRASRNLYSEPNELMHHDEHPYERPYDVLPEPEAMTHDGLHLQFMRRMSQSSSIPPSSSRRKRTTPLDNNNASQQGRSAFAAHSAGHILEDVTKEQSES